MAPTKSKCFLEVETRDGQKIFYKKKEDIESVEIDGKVIEIEDLPLILRNNSFNLLTINGTAI